MICIESITLKYILLAEMSIDEEWEISFTVHHLHIQSSGISIATKIYLNVFGFFRMSF